MIRAMPSAPALVLRMASVFPVATLRASIRIARWLYLIPFIALATWETIGLPARGLTQ